MKAKRKVGILLLLVAVPAVAILLPPLPIPTQECSKTPTAACLRAIAKNFDYNRYVPAELRHTYAAELIKAGFYQEGLELLAKSDSSIRYLDAKDWAAQQVAEDALTMPSKVASFKPLDALKDPSTLAGSIVQEKKPRIEPFFFSSLSYFLTEPARSGGGEAPYVAFNERMALRQFQPNATWDYLLSAWQQYAMNQREPQRSQQLVNIVNQLYRVGDEKNADRLLAQIKITEKDASIYLLRLIPAEKRQKFLKNYSPTSEDDIKAAALAVSQKRRNALALTHDAVQALLDEYAPKKEATALLKKGQQLRRLGTLLYEAGDADGAQNVAQLAYDAEKGPLFSYTDWSAFYRSIGQPEKAKALLAPFIDPSTDSCSPLKSMDMLAIEFYHLGMLDVAAQKIGAFCDHVTVFGSSFGFKRAKVDKKKQQLYTWSRIYRDAVIAGSDTKDIVRHAGDEVMAISWPYLAAHYLNEGDTVRGVDYLTRAIAQADYSNGACDLAYLANSANRPDLIEEHRRQALQFIGTKLTSLQRQTGHLRLAACHNQIRISRFSIEVALWLEAFDKAEPGYDLGQRLQYMYYGQPFRWVQDYPRYIQDVYWMPSMPEYGMDVTKLSTPLQRRVLDRLTQMIAAGVHPDQAINALAALSVENFDEVMARLEKFPMSKPQQALMAARMAMLRPDKIEVLLPLIVGTYEGNVRHTSQLLRRLRYEKILNNEAAQKTYLELLKSPNKTVRFYAGADLAMVGLAEPERSGQILEIMQDTDPDYTFRHIMAQVQAGNYQEISRQLGVVAQKTNPISREIAAWFITEILLADPKHIAEMKAPLQYLMRGKNGQIAADALLALGYKHPTYWRTIIPMLQPAYLKETTLSFLRLGTDITPALCDAAKHDTDVAAQIIQLYTDPTQRDSVATQQLIPLLDCVLATTPTPSHKNLWKRGGHVLAEWKK